MYRVLPEHASTKADHGIRSRVLVSDLKDFTQGESCLIEESEGGNSRFVATIWSLSSLKPNTCMFSSESLMECNNNASKVTINKLSLVETAQKIWINEKKTFSKSTSYYIMKRLHNCIVSEGTHIGVFLGGVLQVYRINKTFPSKVPVRIDITCTELISNNNNNEKEDDNIIEKEEPFAGLENEFNRLSTLLNQVFHKQELNFTPPCGILLYGPPGTGKTLLAHKVVKSLGDDVKLIIIEEDDGNMLEDIFASVVGSEKRIIFMDEIDVLCTQSKMFVSNLISRLDHYHSQNNNNNNTGNLFIIACTNHLELVDRSLRRPGRFDEELEIPPPNSIQRNNILRAHLNLFPNNVSIEQCQEISSISHGFVGADLRLLCHEAVFSAAERGANIVSYSDLQLASKRVHPSCLREIQVTVPNVKWQDIGGMEEVKMAIRETVELPLKHPEIFKKLGIRPPQGVLLYGPPGCSKTMLAKAVATESEMNFIAVKGPELLSKWVGDSEKAIQSTFRRAKQSKPCVVFFDEIDALASTRDSTSGSVSHRVTSQLLQELDGVEPRTGVVVLCATNRPDLLDPALLRPGRIDRCIYIPPPDKIAREEILKIHLKRIPHDFDEVLLHELNTEGFSGAEVASICKDAALHALEKDCNVVSFEEMSLATKRIVPRITTQVLQFYENFAKTIK